jgi:uncharacterized protein
MPNRPALLLSVLPFVLSTSAFGQSLNEARPNFSCSGHLQPAEAVICSDVGLASLDRHSALRNLPADRRNQIETTESAWLTERNRCTTNKSCIRDAYQARIRSLGGYASQNSPPIVAQNPPVPPQARAEDTHWLERFVTANGGCGNIRNTFAPWRMQEVQGAIGTWGKLDAELFGKPILKWSDADVAAALRIYHDCEAQLTSTLAGSNLAAQFPKLKFSEWQHWIPDTVGMARSVDAQRKAQQQAKEELERARAAETEKERQAEVEKRKAEEKKRKGKAKG